MCRLADCNRCLVFRSRGTNLSLFPRFYNFELLPSNQAKSTEKDPDIFPFIVKYMSIELIYQFNDRSQAFQNQI